MTNQKRRNRPERPTIEDIPTQPIGSSKFVRALGSVDPLTRNKAVNALRRWLQMRDSVAPADLITIWKGLFFCYWHSDLTPMQEQLADDLAGLLPTLKLPVAFQYFSAFMLTMRREWFTIDRHRMDKFMNLLRRFVHYLFVMLKQLNWNASVMDPWLQYVTEHVLLADDGLLSVGVSYQLCDVWLPELYAVMGMDKLTDSAAQKVLSPFAATLARSAAQPLIARITESIIEPLVSALGSPDVGQGASDSDDSDELLHMSDDETPPPAPDTFGNLCIVPYAESLFERGSHADVPFRNRNALYHCHELLCMAAKQRERAMAAADAQERQHQDASQARKQRKRDGQAGGDRNELDEADCPGPPNGSARGATGLVLNGKRQRSPGQQQANHGGGSLQHNPGDPGNHQQERVQRATHAAGSAAMQGGMQPAGGHVKKKKRKTAEGQASQQERDATQASAAVESAASLANGVGKGKKLARQAAREGAVQAVNGDVSAPSDKKVAAALPSPASPTVPSTSAASQLAAAALAGGGDSSQKSVRWNLKRNLVFAYGGPVPPPDVRTPPSAKPKGSALKVRATPTRLNLDKKLKKKLKKKKQQQEIQHGTPNGQPPGQLDGLAGY